MDASSLNVCDSQAVEYLKRSPLSDLLDFSHSFSKDSYIWTSLKGVTLELSIMIWSREIFFLPKMAFWK